MERWVDATRPHARDLIMDILDADTTREDEPILVRDPGVTSQRADVSCGFDLGLQGGPLRREDATCPDPQPFGGLIAKEVAQAHFEPQPLVGLSLVREQRVIEPHVWAHVVGEVRRWRVLELHVQEAEGSRERDLLETVDEEMRRLVDLINDLLNFSRYQNGLQKLELAPCDPVELASAAVARFQAQADERGISLQLDVSEDAPRARLDRLQIERVLDNLIGNALRHCQQGGQVAVRLRRQGERVWFSVEDNGEGIAYSQQVRVFEPFVQVGSKKGGAGLGLALCKEVVQLHGGNIGVQSRPGAGAQFYFTLPL